ncbi:MAG: hypothetical protein V7701_12350 [Sneathiella sp.]
MSCLVFAGGDTNPTADQKRQAFELNIIGMSANCITSFMVTHKLSREAIAGGKTYYKTIGCKLRQEER